MRDIVDRLRPRTVMNIIDGLQVQYTVVFCKQHTYNNYVFWYENA